MCILECCQQCGETANSSGEVGQERSEGEASFILQILERLSSTRVCHGASIRHQRTTADARQGVRNGWPSVLAASCIFKTGHDTGR
ncbi:hypothetical protein HII31_13466 [Pseudocercospora fuligena]|uniref:Uncharacterized protein n=1 Tax=Pseudocercospora fuligena TaxID=685502 RepID=A0A8H6R3E0_9PEZI|nr:hypothetical protein HII31_13466 [Pseudocercospora fuligena]